MCPVIPAAGAEIDLVLERPGQRPFITPESNTPRTRCPDDAYGFSDGAIM